MKKTVIGMMMAMAGAMAFAAEQNDFRLTLSTKGVDRYAAAPKTAVLDGEFYALVWTKDAATPVVFNADGTVKPGAELVVSGPWAKDGKCGYVLHQIPAADMARYAGGTFRLVALDTRKADGTLAGYDRDADGYAHPKMVNGYSVVCAMTADAAILSSALDLAAPILISQTSEVPEGTPQPVVTSAKLRQGPNGPEFVIRVKGTAAYLNYTAASVELGGTRSVASADGTEAVPPTASAGASDPDAEIEIVVPATADRGLFKIIRK